MSTLSKREQAALAMYELMNREQKTYAERIQEQRRINSLSDAELKKLVEAQ